jgi:hypothetical protein
MPRRLLPYVLLALLALVFFGELTLHPTRLLYSDYSDLLALHLPSKMFLVRSYQETGELPLWCPDSFAGMPFVHDPQVSAFYPPHWPLLLLPPDRLGAALSWLVVMHVAVAGWCAFAYARWRGLDPLPAFVAAVGYMFAGKWLLHVLVAGHYNMVPIAWLPLVVLALEAAIRTGRPSRAVAAGAAFALIVLGAYPYMTLYAGVFVALWTLGTARESATLARWAGYGLLTAAVGMALGAVQLLPALEAARLATRSGYSEPVSHVLFGGLRALLGLAGPALTDTPANAIWEDRGAWGVLWLVALAWAYVTGGRRTRSDVLVCLLLILYGVGGAALVTWLPGFGLFRYPSRMLMVAAFPLAYLAGVATQALLRTPDPTGDRLRRCRTALLLVADGAVGLTALSSLFLLATGSRPHWPAYWLFAAAGLIAAYRLVGRMGGEARSAASTVLGFAPGGPRLFAVFWVVLLLVDLWLIAWPAVAVRSQDEVYPVSESVRWLAGRRDEHGRVLDRGPDQHSGETPLGAGAPMALVVGVEPLRGFNPIDVRRYKEYLQFVGDADRPLTPLVNPLTFPVLSNIPVENRDLLDLLGVRYQLQPADDPPPKPDWQRVPEADDADPVAYDYQGGVRRLPPFAVYRNETAFPRAFVVGRAERLPARDRVLVALRSADLRQTVFLEDWPGTSGEPAGDFRAAEVVEYTPNRVRVRTTAGPAGYLVLADVWYPGWRCTVDGREVPLYRADYLFRAVELPEGAHEIAFTFEPASYRVGRVVSAAALVVVLGLLLLGAVRRGSAGR